MRICHVGRDIERTGGGEVLKQLAAGMSARGHDVLVITDTPACLAGLPDSVRVRNTFLGARLLAWRPRLRVGWHVRHAVQIAVFTATSTALARRAQAHGYPVINHNCETLVGDIVVMHNTFTAEFRRRSLHGLRRVKALANPVRAARLAKERRLASSAKPRTFVAVAESALPDVEDLVAGKHRVVAIPNGIDLKRFVVPSEQERNAARGRFHLGEDERVVTFIGHEFLRKGLLELIDAMAMVPGDVVLLVAGGESQDRGRFERAADAAGVRSRVRFLGPIVDVTALLAATDVFCIPSRYETVPMVALEALACGVPTVVSEHCPAKAFITPSSGAVCAVTSASIAGALDSALLLPAGEVVRTAVRNAGWNTAVDEYLELLSAPTGADVLG